MLIFYSDLFFLKYSCFRIEFDIGGNPIILDFCQLDLTD